MGFKNFISQFDIFSDCRKYGIPLWQSPQFLFAIMGILIIFSILGVYFSGVKLIDDPEAVVVLVLFLAMVFLAISFVITNSFERLAEAVRMKSEFISIVSHQLRSPLSNLKWAIEFLMSGRADPISLRQLEYFKILKENTSRMHGLISDLLSVSRIDTEKFSPRNEKFYLGDLAKELIQGNALYAKASNIEIIFNQPPESLPKVFADPGQIRQAAGNLIDNAIRYTKEKGRVEIRLRTDKKYVYFEISDNGAGIPSGDQNHIFKKFFRSSNAMKYQTQGSGLGLYIAKSIIEKSGGKIGFESQEDKGSTFWFALPAS